MELPVCSICTDEVEAGASSALLVCGHTFHTDCIVQWFRYHSAQCPNCRATSLNDSLWCATVSERLSMMKRNRRKMPKAICKALDKMSTYKSKMAGWRKEMVELRRTHREVFRKEASLMQNIRLTGRKYKSQRFALASQPAPGIPMLSDEVLPTDDDDDSD